MVIMRLKTWGIHLDCSSMSFAVAIILNVSIENEIHFQATPPND